MKDKHIWLKSHHREFISVSWKKTRWWSGVLCSLSETSDKTDSYRRLNTIWNGWDRGNILLGSVVCSRTNLRHVGPKPWKGKICKETKMASLYYGAERTSVSFSSLDIPLIQLYVRNTACHTPHKALSNFVHYYTKALLKTRFWWVRRWTAAQKLAQIHINALLFL